MIFDDIIEKSKYVMANSNHVRINDNQIRTIANEIKIKDNTHWLDKFREEMKFFNMETITHFLLIYHAIGFCFWGEPKWKIEYKETQVDGAAALIYAMIREIERKPQLLDFRYLCNIDIDEFRVILKGNIEIPLLSERYSNLIHTSKVVLEKLNNNLYNSIKNINTDAELLEFIIEYFDTYKDTRIYQGVEIPYYKRAQLFVSDILHIKENMLGQKVDYHNLVGCADYKIPQILRQLGVIQYSKELEEQIDNKIEIRENSEYEIEIRSSMIEVIDKIKRQTKGEYSAISINDYFWIKSGEGKYNNKPYHRTKTTSY
jgi:hypothetical protein